MTSPPLDRRAFLAGTLAVALAACGDDAAAPTDSTPTSGAGGSGLALAAAFPQSGFLVPGIPQRMPFLLAAADGAPLDAITGDVPISIANAAGKIISELTVAGHQDGVPRPYLPVPFTAPASGTYTVQATYLGESPSASAQFAPPVPPTDSAPNLLQIGDAFPVLDSPTVADARGVAPICTDQPACPLHDQNLADLLRSRRPLLVMVSTPRYCQTNICGPVLDLVAEAAAAHPDLAVIHCEVYANPLDVASVTEATLAAVPQALGLQLEPALFAVGSDGRLRTRLDSIFDRAEISAAIASIS